MRVHHLSCGSMCPYGGKLLGGGGSPLSQAKLIAHCLLVETGSTLVIVDTGFGLGDAANPKQLGLGFRALVQPRPTERDTAIRQIEALGLDPADVGHIICTHLDLDHAGGVADFPNAQVHVLAAEYEHAMAPPLKDRLRYIGPQFRNHKKWSTYGAGGDDWFGFESIRALEGLDAEIALVPLAGHSHGHTGVAVKNGDRWLLHCGDAYFHHGQMESPPHCPPGLKIFQAAMALDHKARAANLGRLQELVASHGDEVTTFSAHDVVELERLRAA